MNRIYLDNNATTAIDPRVLEEMLPFLQSAYGNPSSMYAMAREARIGVETARERIAELLGADPGEIIFTSCGTESDSTAIWSALRTRPNRRHIITSRVEHPAVMNLCDYLGKNGYRISYMPVDQNGLPDLDFLHDAMDDDTAIISLMWANNETGVLFPVEEMARAARDRGILFHTDAVQAAGKIPIDLKAGAIDMLSLSGHKIHAPKGVGVLYVRKGGRFSPFMVGGHQESGRRGGTENVASIVAMGKAARLSLERMEEENTRVKALRDRLETGLLERIPHTARNGDAEKRLPNTTNISFKFIEGEAILLMMDHLNICASSGSACTSGSLEPSHVLRAMDVPYTAAHGSIRFSLSTHTTDGEIDRVLEAMPPVIDRLRRMSPFWEEAAASREA
ncbi:MAG: cysteine desulfurase NifS [Desulfobacterales bacterium]|nr:MAG: cysteine desulfurase NifS [Desulfobacterales bacterium]